MFNSRTETYTYAICLLRKISQREPQALLTSAITALKKTVENHEQNTDSVVKTLTTVLQADLQLAEKQAITELIALIKKSTFDQSPEQKYQNPLSRRFESELQLQLLFCPTTAMLDALRQVSHEIIKVLDTFTIEMQRQLCKLCTFFPDYSVLSFGSLSSQPSIEQIKQILNNNNPHQLATILLIHYIFAERFAREMSIQVAPQRKPIGKLLDIINDFEHGKYRRNPQLFFKDPNAISHIADITFYNSAFYDAAHNNARGRLGVDPTYSTVLGLVKADQTDYQFKHPAFFNSPPWRADAQTQKPDFHSPYVTDLIDNDAIYVSGPSGMMSLYLALMECLANFDQIKYKQLYLATVTAFLVSAGYHSLHEAIGPAHYFLGLVPGYRVSLPTHTKKAAAPNFSVYFELLKTIDPEFTRRHASAWDNFLDFYCQHYQPTFSPLQDYNRSIVGKLFTAINKAESQLLATQKRRVVAFFPDHTENMRKTPLNQHLEKATSVEDINTALATFEWQTPTQLDFFVMLVNEELDNMGLETTMLKHGEQARIASPL